MEYDSPGGGAGALPLPPSSRPLEGAIVGLLFAVVGIVGIAYGARTWLPPLASRHGAGIDSMLLYLLLTTGAIFLVGHLILGFLVWSGSRRRAVSSRMSSRRHELLLSGTLGLVVGIVAEGGVLAIGMPVWDEYFNAVAPADAITVEVTGQQFMWNVRYPGPDGAFGRTDTALIDTADNPIGLDGRDRASEDDVLTQNEIYVPINRVVRIRLKSVDVIHSFFLPHLRVKQDAVPGMSPEVVFTPTVAGTYEIACAELCGLGHYRMQGMFHVVSVQEYEEWLRAQGEPRS